MTKKRRVPEVLWRLFRDRARTLGNTIITLIPKSPPLNSRQFIGGEEDAMSFLLRRNDPSDYRKLLNQCYVVINDDAPSLLEFYPQSRWSQLQIVVRTIEMIIYEQPKYSNVICRDYDKASQSSPVVELLTCSPWNLLSERVGDEFMAYLLRHTLIFLPLSNKKYHQVAGAPINDLCYQKKRKRSDKSSSLLEQSSSSVSYSGKWSFGCVGCNGRNYLQPFRWQAGHNYGQMHIYESATLKIDVISGEYEGNFDEEHRQISTEVGAKPKKRLRPFNWQRRRNRRRMDFQESTDNTRRTTSFTNHGSLQKGLNASSTMRHINNVLAVPCYKLAT